MGGSRSNEELEGRQANAPVFVPIEELRSNPRYEYVSGAANAYWQDNKTGKMVHPQ